MDKGSLKYEKIQDCGDIEADNFDEKKLDAFFNEGEPHHMSYDCKALYDIGLIENDSDAVEFMIDALTYGIRSAAHKLDFTTEGEIEFNYLYGANLDNGNVMHISLARSMESM